VLFVTNSLVREASGDSRGDYGWLILQYPSMIPDDGELGVNLNTFVYRALVKLESVSTVALEGRL
jgi:hypothetical protein